MGFSSGGCADLMSIPAMDTPIERAFLGQAAMNDADPAGLGRDLMQFMALLPGDPGQARQLWQQMLVRTGQRVQAETWLDVMQIIEQADSEKLKQACSGEGSAAPQPTFRALVLSPVDHQRAYLAFRRLPQAPGTIIHLLLSRISHTDNCLQLRFFHYEANEEEVLRFYGERATVFGLAPLRLPAGAQPVLLSLLRDAHERAVYVNGVPVARMPVDRNSSPVGFVVDLLNEGHVEILGLSVQRCQQPLAPLLDADRPLAEQRLLAACGGNSDAALYHKLYAFPGLVLRDETDAVATRLRQALQSPALTKTWLLEALADVLPGEAAGIWRARIQKAQPEPMINVRDLAVEYPVNPAAKSFGMSPGKDAGRFFRVLDGVEFKIFDSEVFGIIGRNGAGKTTLLKTLTGVLPICRGHIRVNGRSLFLKPGAGFREQLSARDNIVFSGIFMGMSFAQVNAVVDEVLEFAELTEVADKPIKFYSDGMRSRLAFALATRASADILFLDELLNAGDISFQEKAMKRLEQLLSGAQVVALVQHGMEFILRRAASVLYLRRGKQVYFGDPEVAVQQYLSENG